MRSRQAERLARHGASGGKAVRTSGDHDPHAARAGPGEGRPQGAPMPEARETKSLVVLIDANNTSAKHAQAIFDEIVEPGEANVRPARISMILCMPEGVSGGDAEFQGFCDGWNKWEGQLPNRRSNNPCRKKGEHSSLSPSVAALLEKSLRFYPTSKMLTSHSTPFIDRGSLSDYWTAFLRACGWNWDIRTQYSDTRVIHH